MNSNVAAMLVTITSVIVSSLVTIRLFEMGKAKEHESQLFKKRSEYYPLLYKLLSDFIKVLEFGTLTESGLDKSFTKKLIIEYTRQLEEWDSANSILINDYTTEVLFAYRSMLYKLIELNDGEFADNFRLPDSPGRKSLVRQTRDLEAAIRWEIRTHQYFWKEYRSYHEERFKDYKHHRKNRINPGKGLKFPIS